MKPSFLLLLLAIALIWTSCSKVDDIVSREDLLRNGNWRQTAGTTTYKMFPSNKDTVYNYWKDAPECYKDNYLTFKANFDGEINYGSKVCDQSEPVAKTFFWELRERDSTLEINNVGAAFYGASDPVHAKIITLSENVLAISYQVLDTNTYPLPHRLLTFRNVYGKF